ncbi:efflux RND transporter periplasmic adaptor subunit [Rurimicrobium arvi]|uniref:Efflux RND transporter periplasmic adaptor subunit n=1 Tax=Rurimicrobium arvi TaxID=2049916 RepID=A0ABP8MFT1_9BACT
MQNIFRITGTTAGCRIAILFLSLQLLGCSRHPATEEKAVPVNDSDVITLTPAQLKNAGIETAVLGEQQLATVLRLNGKIDVPPQSLVSVSVPLGGYLKTSQLLPGMQVRKGEVIAVMEDPRYVQLQQDYLQAKAKLQYSELDFERQRDLNQSQASSDKVMQQAQAERNSLRIQTTALAQQLRLININPERLNENTITKSISVYSPIDGFVSKVNVNIGKYVTPSDVLFELINPSDIHLNLKVYEKDVERLSIGQRLVAYTNANPEQKHSGEIILISRDISSDGISEVHCHFDQYDRSLLPGMYMNAEIATHATLAYAVPEQSIVNFEGKDFVFVRQAQNVFRMYAVELGTADNGFVQIVNHDAFEGKELVTKNAYTLLMKLKNTAEPEE